MKFKLENNSDECVIHCLFMQNFENKIRWKIRYIWHGYAKKNLMN